MRFPLTMTVRIFTLAPQVQVRDIDFSAIYRLTTADGRPLGAVRRRGWRSLWQARYDLLDEEGRECGSITEANPLTAFADRLLDRIPGVGLLTGSILHPVFSLVAASGAELLRVTKQPGFLESWFLLERAGSAPESDETRGILASLMIAMLERRRG